MRAFRQFQCCLLILSFNIIEARMLLFIVNDNFHYLFARVDNHRSLPSGVIVKHVDHRSLHAIQVKGFNDFARQSTHNRHAVLIHEEVMEFR